MRNGQIWKYVMAAVLLAISPTLAFGQRGGGFRVGMAHPTMAAPQQGHAAPLGNSTSAHMPIHTVPRKIIHMNGRWVAVPTLGQFFPTATPTIPSGILDPIATTVLV